MSQGEKEYHEEIIPIKRKIQYYKEPLEKHGDRTMHIVVGHDNNHRVHIKNGKIVVYTLKNGEEFVKFIYFDNLYKSDKYIKIYPLFGALYIKFDRETNTEIVE